MENLRLLFIFLICASASGLVFQNCARVQFTDIDTLVSGSAEKTVETPSVQEVESTNGDAYSGKVTRYTAEDIDGVCGPPGGIRDEIHKLDTEYFLVKDNCVEFDNIALDASEINELSENEIEYKQVTLTQTLPTSCREIIEIGGDDGNGYYTIDEDGPGGNPATSIYCNMQLIRLGL